MTAGAVGQTRKALLEVLGAKEPWRRPIWFMRQAGRYLPEYRALRREAGSFLALCRSPELAAEVTLQPLKRFDLDAAIVFADILLVPEALGASLSFKENEGPVVSRVRSMEDVAGLTRDGLLDRLSPVFETIGRVKAELSPHVALIGFCGAPWTVASYMVEGGSSAERLTARTAAHEHQAWFEALIELLTETAVDYLACQVEAGADAVQIFDSWAGDLDDCLRKRFCVRPMQRIVEGLRSRGHEVPIIGFARGIGAAHRSLADATGISAAGIEWQVPVEWMARELAAVLPVQGNLDPLLPVLGGEALSRGVEHLVRAIPAHRHICNLGHGMMPATPPANVAAMLRHIRALDGTAR